MYFIHAIETRCSISPKVKILLSFREGMKDVISAELINNEAVGNNA